MRGRSAGSRTVRCRPAADDGDEGRAVSGEGAADGKAGDEDVVVGDLRMINDYCAALSRPN